jgi:tetratricopeptide (TPR) repeat protein
MSELITKEDWEALIEVLGDAIAKLDGKRAEPVKLGILEFVSTAAMLGLQDLADVSKRFEGFLLETVALDWNAEAVATLSFSMGALIEKMQLQEYGPKFSSGLGEIALYLQMYKSEESGSEPPLKPEVQTGELTDAILVETPSDFMLEDDELEDLLSDSHLLDEMALPPPPEAAGVASPGAAAVSRIAGELPAALPMQGDRSEKRSAMPNGRDMGFVMDRVDWFKQIMRNDPNSQAFVSLAEEHCFRNQWKEAVATCRRGLAIYPYLTRGRVLMGWALWELGKVDEAERVLSEAKSELEANGILYKILGEISNSRGDSKSARIYTEIFQSIMPQTTEGLLPRATPRRIEDQPVSESPSLVEFLRVLLQRFETKRPKTPRENAIFSDTDRQALRYLLTNTMH